MLISKKNKDIHLTGYSDSNLNKESHEVKLMIDETIPKSKIIPKTGPIHAPMLDLIFGQPLWGAWKKSNTHNRISGTRATS